MEYKIRRTSSVFVMLTGKGEKPFLRYSVNKDLRLIQVIETYVPPSLRGRGLAEKLMKEVMKYAFENNLKIEPVCSYAFYYFIKYKDKRNLLVDWLAEKSDDELERHFEYQRSLEFSKKK